MEQISKAIVALQADLKPVEKNGVNPFFKNEYIKLPDLMISLQPLLTKHKLAVMHLTGNIDGISAIKVVLLHESGETIESDYQPLLLTKQDPQAQGSAITYARRYTLCAMLGIVADEDDDGHAGSNPSASSQTIEYPASDKQKNFLKQLLEQRGIITSEMAEYLADEYGIISGKPVSSADAKMIIEDLLNKKGQ